MGFNSASVTGTWGDVPLADVALPGGDLDPNRVRLDISDEAWAKLGMIGCSHHERTLTRGQCEWLTQINQGRLGSWADEIYTALALAGFEVSKP